MKRMMFLLTILMCIGLLWAGCEKKQTPAAPPEPAATAEPAKPPTPPPAPAAKAEPAAAAAPAAATAGGAAVEGDVETHCNAFYDFTEQMIAAMSKAFGKKMGPGKMKKKMPPREKFLAACKMMPPEVARCMNPKVAMADKEKCQEVMQKADKTQLAKIKEMMK